MQQRAKLLLSSLAGGCLSIAIAMLAVVVTCPDLRIRTLLVSGRDVEQQEGIRVIAVPLPEDCLGPIALGVDDQVFEVAGSRVSNFVDYSRTMLRLRGARLEPGARLYPGADPTELSSRSTLSLVEIEEGARFAEVRFWRQGEVIPFSTWVKLKSLPIGGLSLSLVWFGLQLLIFGVSAVSYWNNPSDRAARAFFVLCSVTLVALLGGGHWWVVSGSPWLSVPFAIASIMLPAVLLHFALLYPEPRADLERFGRWSLLGIYGMPSLTAAAMLVLIVTVWCLSHPWDVPGPFAAALERGQHRFATPVLQAIRTLVYLYLGVAVGYFVATVLAFNHSLRRTQEPLERKQVRWLLAASLAASIPLTYATYLAFFHRLDFALGAAQFPLFLASLSFMLAYALGIIRYRLMLIDRVIRQGLMYHAISAGVMLLYSLLVAAGCALALRQEFTIYGQVVSVVVVMMLAIITLEWVRDRIQRAIERNFFREKYRVSDTLQGMNRAVTGQMDRRALADHVIGSCCEALGVEQGAVYMRPTVHTHFELVTVHGARSFPDTVTLNEGLELLLQRGTSLQRIRAGQSSTQEVMRNLGAALVHGMDVDGDLLGLLAFGEKPTGLGYSAEDAAFLTAVGRTAGFALHFAKVHEDYGRLNADLTDKEVQIAEQGRRIVWLERQLNAQNGTRSGDADNEFHRSGIVGSSPAIRQVLDTVRKVAASDSSVLVRGESGTGKELIARSLHENSSRRKAPLVSLHCGALSPTLLESELFGHVRGAFTDARDDKVGRFQMADGGTLFLDEIGDISRDVQIKLLRVLQQRTFEPVGSNRTVRVDVRVVAATHQNLEQLIRQGVFREDLYFRLNVISITLPPLRERRDDIVDLAIHFLAKAGEKSGKGVLQIDDAAIEALMRYPWPGNIRELENVMERAVVLADGHRITITDLPREVTTLRSGPMHVLEAKPNRMGPLQDLTTYLAEGGHSVQSTVDERQQLLQALQQANGNKAEAARLLDMPRSTFYSKLKKHDLS